MSDSNKDTDLHVEADEKHLLLDHTYDGIQELNHPLPKWWNFLFYAGIVYGFGYWTYYTFLGGPTLVDEMKEDLVVIRQAQQEYKRLTEAFKPDIYAQWNKPEHSQRGLEVFEENCLQCHAEKGKGDVGPNLSDDYWLLTDGSAESNYKVVYYGSEENGMPAWGEVLASEEIYLALSYLESIKNTFQPDGKEPQGEKIGQE